MCRCNNSVVAGTTNNQNSRTVTEYIPVTITYSVSPGGSVGGANTGNNSCNCGCNCGCNCCCGCGSTCSCRSCGLY